MNKHGMGDRGLISEWDRDFSLLHHVQMALVTTDPLIQWVTGGRGSLPWR